MPRLTVVGWGGAVVARDDLNRALASWFISGGDVALKKQ